MIRSVLPVFVYVLVYTTQAKVLEGDGGLGAPCVMGGIPANVTGTCKKLSDCLKDGDEFKRNNEIQLCQRGEPGSDILVCSRNSTLIAEKLCDDWRKYWSIGQRGDCIQENALIFGGEDADLGEFPYIARVGREIEKNKIDWRCGGTLISPHFILSAAHCFKCELKNNPEECKRWDQLVQFWVRLGDHDENLGKLSVDRIKGPIPTILYQWEALKEDTATKGPEEQQIKAKRIIRHPEYDEEFRYFDIALIELEKPAMFTLRVLPVCLQYKYQFNLIDPDVKGLINETITVAGWGSQAGFTPSPVLQKVALNVTEDLDCYPYYPADGLLPIGLMDDHLCAVGEIDEETNLGSTGSCSGDSGGPAVYEPEGDCEHYLVGVISIGNAGCTGYEVFARVMSYLDWITSYIAPNA